MYGERVNLAVVVVGTWLYEHPYSIDSDIPSLFRLTIVLIAGGPCELLWIKTSAKYTESNVTNSSGLCCGKGEASCQARLGFCVVKNCDGK